MEKRHIVKNVLPGSIAEELEITAGDAVIAVNDQPIEDVFDYEFLCRDEYLELLVETGEGEEIVYEIEKGEEEDLGIVFENSLMDDYRSCHNKCIFCFIDQMPPGMRDTLYFKDDDSRLSFLQGNYVTLTNMSDKDIDRIIRYHLAPINVSVHTMNPELRCQMLHNRFAGEALKKLDRLYQAETEMNGQVVLCPGINDGKELDYTIEKLSGYIPYMQSLSIVPVGLTRFRDGLYPLRTLTKQEAADTIDLIESWQKKLYQKHGIHFVHASDEFYLLAGRELPEEERYDGYIQLENGVGMLRLQQNEFAAALKDAEGDARVRRVSLATGHLAAPSIRVMAEQLKEKFPGVDVTVYAVDNNYFGKQITVSGLLTASDLMEQLKDKDLGEVLLLPGNILKSGEPIFLDDYTVEDVSKALDIPLLPVPVGGDILLKAFLGEEMDRENRYVPYEP